MSDHQRETAFLRQCILYEDTVERHNLDAKLTQAQRDERCVRGAVWLMALLTALAIAGLCYSALFLADFPQNKSHLTLKVFGALGLASIISLVAFAGFWGVHRKELDQQREECRRLATKLLESRLGKPVAQTHRVCQLDALTRFLQRLESREPHPDAGTPLILVGDEATQTNGPPGFCRANNVASRGDESRDG